MVRDTNVCPAGLRHKNQGQSPGRQAGPSALASWTSHRQSPQWFLNLLLSRIIQSLSTQLFSNSDSSSLYL